MTAPPTPPAASQTPPVPSAPTRRFPALLRFEVAGYQLFPGPGGQGGISYDVPRGVTVVVGINGLGKTTLLTALFRALAGPREWKSRPLDAPAGSTPITLSDWRQADYFRDRVADDAADATVSVTVGFGGGRLAVTRALRDLRVTALVVDGVEREASQDAYEAAVLELSGFAQFEEFFLALRYLVFLFEDRQSLVWDRSAQADVLRLLFYDETISHEVRRLFDEIQQLDSQFRNTRAQVTRLRAEAATARGAADGEGAGGGALEARIRAAETTEQALGDRFDAARDALERADERRRDLRQRREDARRAYEARVREYERLEQQHYATLFPNLKEVTQYLFARLGSAGGCLVCGNQAPDAHARLRACAAEGRCPVCDSTPERQERVVPAHEVSTRRLEDHDRRVLEAKREADTAVAAAEEAAAAFEAAGAALAALEDDLALAQRELRHLAGQRPAGQAERTQIDRALRTLEVNFQRQQGALTGKEDEFERVIARGESRIGDLAAAVIERFRRFARAFLAESCDLVYETDRRRIGQQGRQFEFPVFRVRMTSAVSPDTLQERSTAAGVSESQREFIDLAFRMALIDVAAAGDAAMLVLETPEASLDTVFVARAGQLLGHFATAGGGVGNRLIASSNLTRGEMIGALLGAVPPEDPAPADEAYTLPPEQRAPRVIDLLSAAAPNAALRTYEGRYRRALEDALYPEREVATPRTPS